MTAHRRAVGEVAHGRPNRGSASSCGSSRARLRPPRTRRPEHERLAVMVGRWQTEVDVKATPTGPALSVKGTEECAWFANLHVVCRNESKMESGPYSSIRLLSYQTSIEADTPSIRSTASASRPSRSVRCPATSGPSPLKGRGCESRLTLTMTPTGYTGVSEFAIAQRSLVAVSSVKATRQKP